MRRQHPTAGSHNVSQDVCRIGFADANGPSAQWKNVKLSDLPSGFAKEVVANLTRPMSSDLETLLTELRRISAHRLTLLIPKFDAESEIGGRPYRLSRLLAISESLGLVLRNLQVSSDDDNGIWLYFVCNDEHPYDGERLSLLQSTPTTIYEHVARYGFLVHLVQGKRVLDVGCGAGFGAALLSSFASEIAAIDISSEAIADARKFRPHPAIRYEQRDALVDELQLGLFDVIICLEVLEHLSPDAQKRLIQNMSQWLAAGGCVVCSTPNPLYDPPNPFHEAPLDAPALDALFASAFPHRALFTNSVAMGGIVIPMADDFESEVRFFDWDAEGRHIRVCAKDEQQPTYFVLMASRSPLPQLKCSVSLDIGNQLLQSLQITRKKEQLFRSEESSLLMYRLRNFQELLSQTKLELTAKREQLRDVEAEVARLKQSITTLERQVHHYQSQLEQQQHTIEQLESTLATARDHAHHVKRELDAVRLSRSDLRVALIRNERERLHLKQQLEAPHSKVAGYIERIGRGPREAWQALFAPVVIPGLPSPPREGDREPATVALWQYTYQRLTLFHEKCTTLLDEIEGAPRFNRLRAIVRRLQSFTGHAVPPATNHLQTVIAPQPGPTGAEFNDPSLMYNKSRQLHAQVMVLAHRLEYRSARLYRALHPTWDRLKQVKRWLSPTVEVPAAVELCTNQIRKRIIERQVAVAHTVLAQDACPDLITIVTPTFNRKELLRKAVASVLGQSYVNWELIVVDDGSTDGTEQLQEEYNDARICWATQPRGGVCKARNTALKLAQGTYIAFLDSDNVWYPEFLEKMHQDLSQASDHVVAVHCNLNLFYGDRFVEVMDDRYTPSAMFHRPQIDLNALMVRRSALERVGFFDERMNKWVDYELMLRLSRLGHFNHVRATLVDYFRLDDGITRAKESERPLGPNLAIIRETRRTLLKVGYVQWDYPAASQAFAHREIEALKAKGIDVRVYYKEDADPAASSRPDVPSYKVQGPDDLARLAREHGVHMLHGYFAYPHTTLLLWPAAQKAGIFFSFSGHGVDIFHHQNETRSRLKEIASSNLCKVVFVIGTFHQQYFVNKGVSEAKIRVNRCMVDDQWLHMAGGNLERPVRRIVLVGRFIEKKDPLLFLEVARACQTLDIEFELYGYGPLETDVLKAAEGLPNTKVEVGALSNRRVREIMDAADVLLLPCRRAPNGDMDGLPVVLIEAACRGLLLISSSVSSIPDLVEDGVTGLVANEGDVDGFTAAVHQAVQLTPQELGKLRRRALDRIRAEFTPDVVTEKLITNWCR